jgi:hypothetical protein
METIAKNENQANYKKIALGCQLHRFFRNKVYSGLENELLIRRKIYIEGADGIRKNRPYYLNKDKSLGIEEMLLVELVEQILEAVQAADNIVVTRRTKEAEGSYFQLRNTNILKQQELTENKYKDFINACLEEAHDQEYENMKLQRDLKNGYFKEIIKKIEIYETGIVCIFNNGFEMSIQC